MPQDEVETLEAALNFITQYELSSAATSDTVDLTPAFEHSHKLNKSHSLEVPVQRHTQAFTHSHSLEIPEDETNAAFDVGFHAAEEFLDDIKGENELFDTSTDSGMQDALNLSVRPATPTPTPHQGDQHQETASSATPNPRRRHRVSKKAEISELRDTVAELSQQLDKLQASSAPNSPAGAEEEHVRSILSQPESLWQQIAARQLLLRQQAEDANAQLRTLVETCVRQTKNLKRMLSRRNDSETLELIGLKRRKQVYTRGTPPEDNDKVFAKLLNGTDELNAGLDKFFADKGMPQVPCPGRKRQVQRNAVNGAIVVFLDKNQVPFGLEKTGEAVWKLLADRHRKDGPYKQGRIDCESQQTGNTITNSVSFTCVAGNVMALLQVREVARRYVTDDRTVFISLSGGMFGSDKTLFQLKNSSDREMATSAKWVHFYLGAKKLSSDV